MTLTGDNCATPDTCKLPTASICAETTGYSHSQVSRIVNSPDFQFFHRYFLDLELPAQPRPKIYARHARAS